MFGKNPAKQQRTTRAANNRASQVARGAPASVSISTGTKIQIDNLQRDVNRDDLEEIFSTCGRVKKAAVHYDENGQSIGSAVVVFSKSSDAQNAAKKFNGTKVDGRPMRIELIETKSVEEISRASRAPRVQSQNNGNNNKRNAPRRNNNNKNNNSNNRRGGNRKKSFGGNGAKDSFGAPSNPLLR